MRDSEEALIRQETSWVVWDHTCDTSSSPYPECPSPRRSGGWMAPGLFSVFVSAELLSKQHSCLICEAEDDEEPTSRSSSLVSRSHTVHQPFHTTAEGSFLSLDLICDGFSFCSWRQHRIEPCTVATVMKPVCCQLHD